LDVPVQEEKAEEQKFQAVSLALTQRLIEPVLSRVGSSKNWIVSPDGSLWAINWAALWIRDGRAPRNGHYFVEDHRFVNYVVSTRDLIRTWPTVQTTPPLIMADPDYDLGVAEARQISQSLSTRAAAPTTHPSTRAMIGLKPVSPLPDTRREALKVAESLQHYANAQPRIRLGKDAVEAEFKNVHSPKLVYLTTHGFFFPLQELGVDESTYQAGTSPLENPLLRCGLTLASCNRREPRAPDDDDGYLTGMEIAGTDLRGTELAVLSACETGLGDVWAGQSAAGLRQAFELAGAKTVVASLWSVPEVETTDLLSGFISNLSLRKPKGEALATSEINLLQSRLQKRQTAHPFYWAGFTLTGQWQ
ncbi:MAG TPA: CHAT domain-containing protein, partial [Candidatus Dormibacteraeota bacterium]|nr:CHAT domain-containing protein [Candidatus Dormibacteraeota bacterium]